MSQFVWEDPCTCENPSRRFYTYRGDGLLHCEQCDGRLPDGVVLDVPDRPYTLDDFGQAR